VKTVEGGTSTLVKEPETMPTTNAGKPGEGAPSCAPVSHHMQRVARRIVLRAALGGRLSWHVALPLLSRIGGGAA
jgi:hypothetical protein